MERKSNIELLRIISMIGIVFFHSFFHGGYDHIDNTLNTFFLQFMQLFGEIGVNIFMLITGYFLIDIKKNFKETVKKASKTWSICLFYSILISLVFWSIGEECINSVSEFASIFMPITFNKWWFASVYIIVLFVSPVILPYLKKLKEKEYIYLLIIMFMFFTLIPTITRQRYYVNQLTWYFFLVFLSGYIKRFVRLKHKAYVYIGLSFAILLCEYLLTLLIDLTSVHMPMFGNNVPYFFDYNYLPAFLVALFCFCGFLRIDIGTNKIINCVASTTFGIYLIHDHPDIRNYFWKDLFYLPITDDNFILKSGCRVVVVFMICLILELFRINLFKLLKKNVTFHHTV